MDPSLPCSLAPLLPSSIAAIVLAAALALFGGLCAVLARQRSKEFVLLLVRLEAAVT